MLKLGGLREALMEKRSGLPSHLKHLRPFAARTAHGNTRMFAHEVGARLAKQLRADRASGLLRGADLKTAARAFVRRTSELDSGFQGLRADRIGRRAASIIERNEGYPNRMQQRRAFKRGWTSEEAKGKPHLFDSGE